MCGMSGLTLFPLGRQKFTQELMGGRVSSENGSVVREMSMLSHIFGAGVMEGPPSLPECVQSIHSVLVRIGLRCLGSGQSPDFIGF